MKEYEYVGQVGDAGVYRLKDGLATVTIYDKAAVTPAEIVERCEAAERELDCAFEAKGVRTLSPGWQAPLTPSPPAGLGPLEIGESPGGLIITQMGHSSGYTHVLVSDHELPDLMAAVRRRWEGSYARRKADKLAAVRVASEALERARTELEELKKDDPNRGEDP